MHRINEQCGNIFILTKLPPESGLFIWLKKIVSQKKNCYQLKVFIHGLFAIKHHLCVLKPIYSNYCIAATVAK